MGSFRIGIDAGGTKVAYGLFDQNNSLVGRRQHPTPADADGPQFSDLIIENCLALLQEQNLKIEDLRGIGVCMPSFILFDEGYICMTSAMENIRDFAMREYLTQRLPVPIVLDNDSNCAALAEYRFGAGRGSRHMVYMSVSTGIGSGLIINGELFRGSYGWAGETGHMLITPDEGLECGCRNRGCFMSWAGGDCPCAGLPGWGSPCVGGSGRNGALSRCLFIQHLSDAEYQSICFRRRAYTFRTSAF